jgi:hypothetical protein
VSFAILSADVWAKPARGRESASAVIRDFIVGRPRARGAAGAIPASDVMAWGLPRSAGHRDAW